MNLSFRFFYKNLSFDRTRISKSNVKHFLNLEVFAQQNIEKQIDHSFSHQLDHNDSSTDQHFHRSMQERSSTLPMCSVDRSTYIPSTMNTNNHSTDSHSSSTAQIHDAGNISNDSSSTSTPELNLLLDKLTEILRFRSGCRRHSGGLQPTPNQPAAPSASTSNLKRLQSSSIEPLHHMPDLPASTTGPWKSSTTHKSTLSTRSHHHHHHHQTNLSAHIHNLDRKRRLPSLLQRLIDEGNLIKEAVRRLKTQKFAQAFKGPMTPATSNLLHTPSTPTTKTSSTSTQSIFNSSSASMAISVPSGQISDPPSQSTASPSRGISWFLSSSVFGVNASATTTTNHSSGSGSPLRTCYSSSSTHDRTPMEIGIHDG